MTASQQGDTDMKLATYYQPGPGVFLFTCWNEQRTGCGCHTVYAAGLQANIEALQRLDYQVRHAVA